VRPRALVLYTRILENRKSLLTQSLQAAKKKYSEVGKKCWEMNNWLQKLEEELAGDELAGRGAIVKLGLPILAVERHCCVRCARGDLAINNPR
jgi:hypothetical protein